MENTKNMKCNCKNKIKWTEWLTIILLIALFIMLALCLHYLWKLSDIWEAVKNSK